MEEWKEKFNVSEEDMKGQSRKQRSFDSEDDE